MHKQDQQSVCVRVRHIFRSVSCDFYIQAADYYSLNPFVSKLIILLDPSPFTFTWLFPTLYFVYFTLISFCLCLHADPLIS